MKRGLRPEPRWGSAPDPGGDDRRDYAPKNPKGTISAINTLHTAMLSLQKKFLKSLQPQRRI